MGYNGGRNLCGEASAIDLGANLSTNQFVIDSEILWLCN